MKNKALHEYIDRHKSKDVVIVTAGPSLNSLDKTKLRNFCEGKFIIAVKQAIHLLDSCDLHVINDDNFELYKYDRFRSPPKVVYAFSGSLYKRIPKGVYDFRYEIPRSVSSLEMSLSSMKNFEEFTDLFSSNKRPLGPGIMYELCIFFPLYFSSKTLHLFGWDIGLLDDDKISRFYQKSGFVSKLNGFVFSKSINLYNNVYIHIENVIRYILFLMKFKIRINVPGITKGEAKFIADSTEGLFDFYKEHNIEVTVYSKTSLLSKRFRRDDL